jgi:hypothetical protein
VNISTIYYYYISIFEAICAKLANQTAIHHSIRTNMAYLPLIGVFLGAWRTATSASNLYVATDEKVGRQLVGRERNGSRVFLRKGFQSLTEILIR